MADKIVNLGLERAKREAPDPDFVRRDDFGREMYLFLLEYQFENGAWSTQLWAYSMEDAQARVDAMRESLALRGQAFASFPA